VIRYRQAIEDDGFYGYLGGDHWQTPADHRKAAQLSGISIAVRSMFEFRPADEACPPYCPKCPPKRRP
jgi:hypothetical protein